MLRAAIFFFALWFCQSNVPCSVLNSVICTFVFDFEGHGEIWSQILEEISALRTLESLCASTKIRLSPEIFISNLRSEEHDDKTEIPSILIWIDCSLLIEEDRIGTM